MTSENKHSISLFNTIDLYNLIVTDEGPKIQKIQLKYNTKVQVIHFGLIFYFLVYIYLPAVDIMYVQLVDFREMLINITSVASSSLPCVVFV